jgi:hypothetical protein
MSRSLAVLPALAASLLVALTPSPALAADGVSFEEVLPKGTLGFVLVDDMAALREDLASTSWGRVLADPEMSAVRGALEDGLSDMAARGSENWGHDPLSMFNAVEGQVAFALLELALPKDPMDDTPGVALALLMELGDGEEEFGSAFDGLIERWVDDSGQLLKTETVRELPAALVVDPDGREGEMAYLFAESVLVMVLTSSDADATELAGVLVDGLRGEAEDALLDQPEYTSSVACRAVVEPAGVRMWGHLGAAWEVLFSMAEADDEDSVQGMRDMGLDQLRSLANTTWIDDGWVHSKGRVDVAEPEGLWSVLAATIDDQRCRLLDLVPPGVATAFAADLDLGAGFDAALELVASIDPELGLGMITDMAEMEAELGFHPKDDLLDGLDGQFMVFMSEVDISEALPLGGGEPMNFCLAAGLYDGEEMRRLVDALVRRNGLHAARTRVEFEGYDLYLIPLGPGLKLAYAVLDDLLVLSASPSLVQDVLRRKANPELLSLASSDFFSEARAKLPEAESFVQYARAGDSIRTVFSLLEEIQRTGAIQFNPLEPPEELPEELLVFLRAFTLPEGDVVERHVGGAELAVWSLDEAGGITVDQVLP